MRFRKERVFLLLLTVMCTVLTATSTAQENRAPAGATYSTTSKTKTIDRHAKPPVPRILTADEGLAILGAALESRAHHDFESDCSHLVHAIYERAGFPYSYQPSATLYTGDDEFRRVAHPQPGDLVVWPGHVGIAVNPAQRSFFSALRSGLGVDSYDSLYWRERGRPRFFRYVTDAPVAIQVASSSREANVKATASRAPHPPVARNINFTAGEEPETPAEPARTIVPGIQLVNSPRPKPTEVSDALEQTFIETEKALRGQDVLKPSRPLIVFDQLSVERVRLQRDRGWAEVRISGVFKLPRERLNSTKRTERQRWPLVRRDHNTWELTLPPEAIYIPSDVAVRMLVHQLAALTAEPVGQPRAAEEKVELSRLLSVLLEKQPGPGE
jgi:hypothetical protein